MAAVGLAVLLLVSGASKTSVVGRAAALAARGETAEAHHLIEPLAMPSNPAALFVLASIALEEGQLETAARLAKQVASTRSGAVEGVVLGKLIEERKRAPQDRWTDVAARAWSASGPQARAARQLLGTIDVQRPIDRAVIARANAPGDKLLLEFGRASPGSAALIEAATAEANAVEHPFGVQLVAMRVLLDAKVPEEKRSHARSTALDLLGRIARSNPDDGYLASGVVLLRSETHVPFQGPDLESMEEALNRKTFVLPVRALFEAFKNAYQRADPGQAYARAFFETAGALPLDIHLALSRRAAATTDPVQRERAAAVLTVAGCRLEAGSTFLDRMVGLSLQTAGAELRGDSAAIDAVKRKRAYLTDVMSKGNAFWSYQWPIASLWRDHFVRNTTDEVGYYELMAK